MTKKIDHYREMRLMTNAAAIEKVARTLINWGYQGPEAVVEMSRKIVEALKAA